MVAALRAKFAQGLAIMQTAVCIHCHCTFHFDPSAASSSSGTVRRLPNNNLAMIVQCPHCKKWVSVTLEANPPQQGGSGPAS